ncbi:hypothetical protein CC78DRAFT_577951 [Lojkania enalia]|uniref:Uncharacterized protein n=1 Tax=Lojkania enalia TaxID=147567 RepID=A0A9P4N5W1_9PLEO|nr:hypothetical protein CC78DRAFT_577951 [Didymosphaeria enalia]
MGENFVTFALLACICHRSSRTKPAISAPPSAGGCYETLSRFSLAGDPWNEEGPVGWVRALALLAVKSGSLDDLMSRSERPTTCRKWGGSHTWSAAHPSRPLDVLEPTPSLALPSSAIDLP